MYWKCQILNTLAILLPQPLHIVFYPFLKEGCKMISFVLETF